ncbi:hypothetical protein SCP_0202830 [Sparassis crispa]|uniref:Serine/threonine-protein phosphatase 1 regulatory subunit 10 n=1 Tax=Sparassis crispa TaxID=139825 RepID=A0A401GA72_9APHY|nr:hypothetical protein SCP_0202830 [Sparassis crispa]GBE79086.1 hypothetical protein SCP_0202830 [Sparassis crispa]
MEYSGAWLQQHQIPDLQAVAHDGQHPANDDWKENTSVQPSAGSSQPMDLSDFVLGDMSVPPASSSSLSSSSTGYFATFPQQGFFLSTTPGPFNVVQYGSSPWAPNSNQLPLSSYSSLNGATSASSSAQQQSSSSNPTMMIDPALTTMSMTAINSSASPSIQHYQHSPPFLSSQPQQRTQFQYQHQPHQPTLSINPSFVHTSTSHYQAPQLPRSTSQQQQQQQGTLSPFVLHSPANTLNSPVTPNSFYASLQPILNHSAPTISPEQRKIEFLNGIRPLLSPTSFTGAGAVSQLVGYIEDYGVQEVEPQTRLEILTKMRDNAGNHYFRAWVENEVAMDVTREWLKLAYTGKNDPQLVETIMPLLHVIDRLPLTIESLKSSKLGKIVVRLVKEPPAPAIKDMAANLERKWRQLLASSSDSSKHLDSEPTEDVKGKKRKADALKAAPPAKKVVLTAPGSSSKPVVVKKESSKSVVREVKDAKTDSSFFSAPKPKAKLPSFKKAAPAVVKKEPDPNVSQPSSINPFEEALKLMKSRKDSPATATPPPMPAPSVPVVSTGLTSSGKQKKRVTWAPEGKLEMVKLIERAVYDDDPADGMHTTHNVRDLDRDEGAALHAHLFEEQIEWLEPILIVIPPDIDARPKGEQSQEKVTQEQREQSALVALYMSAAQIPDSPAEPPSQIPEEQVDEKVRMMLTGPEVDTIFWSGGAPAALEPPKSSVAELVGQLASSSGDVTMGDASHAGQQLDPKSFGFDPATIPALANVTPEQLQNLMQQAQALVAQGGMFAPGQSGDYSERGGYYDEGRDRRWSEEGYSDRGSSRGRTRGRGRGRGDGYRSNKRKPCSFFAAGRCRYGDQCDFSHEPIY